MNRRQFAFWLGYGLFNLSEKLRADGLDQLAAATMRVAEPRKASAVTKAKAAATPVHWTAAGDDTWRWYKRENLVKGQWVLTGITTPIHRETGQRKWEPGGYLADELLPAEIRAADKTYAATQGGESAASATDDQPHRHLPTSNRRGRHGRPPSKWLRSLHAYELSIWLKSIEVPEADVSGMTTWTHLTRDHLFDADRIVGLSESEQAKLHAAAHYGY